MCTILSFICIFFALTTIFTIVVLAYETKHAILVDDDYNIIKPNEDIE